MKLISLLVRWTTQSQSWRLFFLRYFLVSCFKCLLENCLSETAVILLLKCSVWTALPGFLVFPFIVTFSCRNCSEFPGSKLPSSAGWVSSTLSFQVDFLSFSTFFGAVLKASCAIREWPCLTCCCCKCFASTWRHLKPRLTLLKMTLLLQKERGRGIAGCILMSELITLGRIGLSHRRWYVPRLVTPQITSLQNSCWFKSLNFGVLCYSVIANWCIPQSEC